MTPGEVWMAQQTGKPFYLLLPKAEDVCIESLEISMDHLARYNGQTVLPLPVGAHCGLVARMIEMRWPRDVEAKLYAYLHDAHEALWGDLLRPVQEAIELVFPGFLAWWKSEMAKTDRAIFTKLGLPEEFPSTEARARVKQADGAALYFERRKLMGAPDAKWRYDHMAQWWIDSMLKLDPLAGPDWKSALDEAMFVYKNTLSAAIAAGETQQDVPIGHRPPGHHLGDTHK